LVLDSESSDGTAELARAAGFRVETLAWAEFSHGGTRQLGAEMLPDAEILIYMTQDAVLASADALEKLIAPFEDPQVAAVCGRQLPRAGAGAIEAHAREFNYPAASEVRTLASRERIGIKAAFLSNSLAAYRRDALMAVGGFPADTIFGEDTLIAARLLLAGYKVAYVAEAAVYHSHSYTAWQEFKRYFDIGVLHSREPWLLGEFGGTNEEGKRFVISELRYLQKSAARLVPSAVIRTGMKWLGYKLGRREAGLSPAIKRKLSMHSGYWK
jgi:rhamnosyltransferase